MACADIEGEWEMPTLLADTGEVMLDPVLVITPTATSGLFIGKFQAADEQNFDIHCNEHGMFSRIRCGREHPDGISTDYDGKVVRVPQKRKVVLVGRFTRNIPGAAAALVGDWETEKPT